MTRHLRLDASPPRANEEETSSSEADVSHINESNVRFRPSITQWPDTGKQSDDTPDETNFSHALSSEPDTPSIGGLVYPVLGKPGGNALPTEVLNTAQVDLIAKLQKKCQDLKKKSNNSEDNIRTLEAKCLRYKRRLRSGELILSLWRQTLQKQTLQKHALASTQLASSPSQAMDPVRDPGVFQGDPKEFHTWFGRLQSLLKMINMPPSLAIPYIISRTSGEVWDVLRPRNPDWSKGDPFQDVEEVIFRLQYFYDDSVEHREQHKRTKYPTLKQKDGERFGGILFKMAHLPNNPGTHRWSQDRET